MAVRPETSGMVYNIQRFSIHDGPGIRTTVFLKGCPLRCFWCQNPESQRSRPELFVTAEKCLHCGRCIPGCPTGACQFNEAGLMTVDRKKCVACGACMKACPKEAISVWRGCFAAVNVENCIGCGRCAGVCPAGCIVIQKREGAE